MILDIHTHRPAPCPQGIVQAYPDNFAPVPGQLYSLGLHPWNIPSDPSELLRLLTQYASHPQVVMLGETGIDELKGAPMFLQNQVFQAHIALSEQLGKPLLIHCVKAYNSVLEFRKELGARQPWIIHGFRARLSVARMFLQHPGFYLSFGEFFNEVTLRSVPAEVIFAETDESKLSIGEIISRLSEARGDGDLTPMLKSNFEALGIPAQPD